MSTYRLFIIPTILTLVIVLIYLFFSQQIAGFLAYPLDDAWIHHTYARTVAHHGEWAYRAGEENSGGSTAPLWTLLLALGHQWSFSPIWWGYSLGILGWLATIIFGGLLSTYLFQDKTIRWASTLALATEWHLAWAALSGMEITLYSALILCLLVLYLSERRSPWWLGLIGGALTLTRPEGIVLLGLIGLHWLWEGRHTPRQTIPALTKMTLGWLIWVVPYLIFNWQVNGFLFPNTFYAKQEEYGILLASVPIWERAWSLGWQPWIGGQVLFLFALPWLPWRQMSSRQWLPLIWALSIVWLYILRLPVTYQHGRYLMPTIPIFLIYGSAGFIYAWRQLPALLRRPVAISAIAAFTSFVLLGAQSYAQDVSFIECEMATTAQWIANQSEPDDLIAAHDIGRLGYLTNQSILDFAGLISSEAIPIIRDEEKLLDLAQEKGARYVVIFADWYPTMSTDPRLTVQYETSCIVTQEADKEPMTIYTLEQP